VKTKIIATLTGASISEMRQAMRAAAAAGADLAEFRLDWLQRIPDDGELADLFRDAPLETIATCRPLRQGGRYDGDEARRLAILVTAAACGATFVDVEDDVPEAMRPSAALILSHHNFAAKPPTWTRLPPDWTARPRP